MQPFQMQFQLKKLDHNFVLNLYNFVHQVPNFVHTSFFSYPQFKFGGIVTCSSAALPKGSFNIKNWSIILYSFCTILYTLPSSAFRNSNLVD